MMKQPLFFSAVNLQEAYRFIALMISALLATFFFLPLSLLISKKKSRIIADERKLLFDYIDMAPGLLCKTQVELQAALSKPDTEHWKGKRKEVRNKVFDQHNFSKIFPAVMFDSQENATRRRYIISIYNPDYRNR